MLEAKQSGNVVEDFTIGNTRIKICDDFCRTRTSGEVKEILDRVARRTVGSLTAAATPDYVKYPAMKWLKSERGRAESLRQEAEKKRLEMLVKALRAVFAQQEQKTA